MTQGEKASTAYGRPQAVFLQNFQEWKSVKIAYKGQIPLTPLLCKIRMIFHRKKHQSKCISFIFIPYKFHTIYCKTATLDFTPKSLFYTNYKFNDSLTCYISENAFYATRFIQIIKQIHPN